MAKREYIQSNKDWLEAKAKEEGVKALPKGIYYKVLIEGWIIATQQMHIGDKWELYIPAEMGYGKFSQPGIPGGSTLIFEIELLGIS
jgi:FKBP-type peptidyl-prolyl cis-trans isomerase